MKIKDNSNAKDTIYLDAEDDITVIIEKIRASESRVVALVLPKRATTLQSIVNLKLLKRSAKSANKSIVLITSEAGLLPIAGAAGLHVAKTLQSKPEVPESPQLNSKETIASTGNKPEGDEPNIDPATSIGQLAGHLATEETIELDNETADNLPETKSKSSNKKPFNKKFKVPNFNRFRLFLFGGLGLLILILVGGVFALVILPKAQIVIKTDTSNINSDLVITAKTDATSVDNDKLIIPAVTKSLKKTDTEKVPTTGKRDDGTKAKGTMTLTNCIDDGQSHTVPAGTGFSSGSTTFVTDSALTLEPALYSGSSCKSATFGLSKSVPVTASQAGDTYNLGARSYNSPASLSTAQGSVQATGSNMTGGTSKIIQVASQTDIDNAKQKVVDRLNSAVVAEIKSQFETDKLTGLTDTFAGDNPAVVSTPNVNEPGAEVNVSVTITFTELGVKNDDLKQVVENDVKKHIDSSKQVIQDNGIGSARIQVTDKKSANEVKFSISTLAVAGPQLDTDGIKKQIAGKKKKEAESIIKSRPGIIDVTTTYKPFWVYSTPKNINKITITYEQNDSH